MEIVISRMHDDKTTAVARTDPLILQYGRMLLRKLGEKRALDISARMRELARIVISLSQNDASIASAMLSQSICGQGFDKILNAIELEGKPQTGAGGRRIFEKPSFVIKVGGSLVKCAQIKRGVALREGDAVAVKEVEDFLALYNSEYTDKMASAAHASYRIKGNTLCEFPDETDLRMLREYQQQRINMLVEEMNEEPNEFLWRELAEVTLTRILVFNARRGSEAAELTVQDYLRSSNTADPVLMAALSTVEKQLLQRLTVLEVIGKRNRPVPILLTADMKKAADVLLAAREPCGIKSSNIFLFALPKTQKSRLSFYGTLRRVAHRAGLKKPHLLTTTRMRKHLATMAQVNCCFGIDKLSIIIIIINNNEFNNIHFGCIVKRPAY